MGIIVKKHSYHKSKSRIRPPGPVLKVKISDPANGKKQSVLALIDSGADITCISEDRIKHLEKAQGFELMPQSVEGINSKGEVVEVDTLAISIILKRGLKRKFWHTPDHGILPRPRDFFGDEDMLIGRDILNKLEVALDGPNQNFTIKDPKHC